MKRWKLALLLGFGLSACAPAAPSAQSGDVVVVVAPDDRPVHDCLLGGDPDRCGRQPDVSASTAASLDQLARRALAGVGPASWPQLEVNRAFPRAESLVAQLRSAGCEYDEDDWFGPETPPVWVVSLGGSVDVRVMQAIIAAAVLSGAEFGVEFIGKRVDGGMDHSERAYVGSLDAEAEDPITDPAALRVMLQPGSTASTLISQGFIDEEAPP